MGIMVILRIELDGAFRPFWKAWKKVKKMTGSGQSIINTRNVVKARGVSMVVFQGALICSCAEILIHKVTLQARNLDQPGCCQGEPGLRGDGRGI